MKGWLIFGIILLVLWLIGRIRAQIVLIYKDEIVLRLKVLGLTFGILPKKARKPIAPDDFSPAKYRKLLKKEAKKQAKKDAKKAKKQAKKVAKAAEKKKAESTGGAKKKKKSIADILDLVYLLLDALKAFGKTFGKRFEIEAVKLHITVGAEDAAQTALLFGIVSQAVAYVVEILSSLTNLRVRKQNRSGVMVEADFTSEQITADLHLVFKLRLWHIFAMLFSALGGIIKNRLAAMKKQSKPVAASVADSGADKANSEES